MHFICLLTCCKKVKRYNLSINYNDNLYAISKDILLSDYYLSPKYTFPRNGPIMYESNTDSKFYVHGQTS